MINRINNTTSKANPPAKPQPSPQLPLYPITIVPPLNQRGKLGGIPWVLIGPLYLMYLSLIVYHLEIINAIENFF